MLLIGGIIIAIGLLTLQSYRLIRQYRHAEREYNDILHKITPLTTENTALQTNIDAFKAGQGTKRALNNAGYAAQGEKMIIIIPKE